MISCSCLTILPNFFLDLETTCHCQCNYDQKCHFENCEKLCFNKTSVGNPCFKETSLAKVCCATKIVPSVQHFQAFQVSISLTMAQSFKSFRRLDLGHSFLKGGPCRGSEGSTKIFRIKYCTPLNLFYKDSGVYQWHLLTLWGSMETFLRFRGPRSKKG